MGDEDARHWVISSSAATRRCNVTAEAVRLSAQYRWKQRAAVPKASAEEAPLAARIVVPMHKRCATALTPNEIFQGTHDFLFGQAPACGIFVHLPIAEPILNHSDDLSIEATDECGTAQRGIGGLEREVT
jgi:hypothetical protein